MAFTTQEEAILKILAASYVEAGYTSQGQVVATLTRQRLEQELAVIQSNRRNAMVSWDGTVDGHNAELAGYDQAERAKQSEIDAL